MTPDCYKCQYRGEIAGDAHSCCRHPSLGKQDDNFFGAMVDAVSGKNLDAMRQLHITGHEIGIRRGWFLWPADFDPTWLLTCDGFTDKSVTPKESEHRV
jgi:hypothetical protein